jgi:hypothetical protein
MADNEQVLSQILREMIPELLELSVLPIDLI